MSNCYVSSGENNDQGQSSSAMETLSFRVEPTSVSVFIAKLYTILNDNTVQEMVSWSNDGERFCVYDIPSFSKKVLPLHFKHNNWPSFVRQLNMYGFHKMNDNFNSSHGQTICEFHHPYFYQNGRRSLRKIRRNSNRKTTSTSLDYTPRQQHQPHQPHLPQQQHPEHLQQHQSHQKQNLHYERRKYQHQPQHYLRHNIQHQQQQSTSLQESTTQSTSTSTNIASSSNIPILSLLSSNHQRYDDHNSMVDRNQLNNGNSGSEYQDTYMTNVDSDERNMKGKHRQYIVSTTIHNSNESNHRDYIIEGSSNNIMNVSNLTTENHDRNDNAATNQPRYLMVDCNINTNMDVDKCKDYQLIDNDDDIDFRDDMNSNNNNYNMDEVDDDDDNDNDDNDNDTLATESYTTLNGRLNQLRKRTTDLNSEVFMLRGCVTELQQSVVVLLDCLSDAISCSDSQDRSLLDKIQVGITEPTHNDKYTIEPDNNGQSHDHHQHQQQHHHVHDQRKASIHHEQLNNNNSVSNTSYVNDVNRLKKGIRDILHRSRQDTELAKKNHHMHLHPQGYNWDAANYISPTPLNTNNINKQ